MPPAALGQLVEPTIELVESWMRQARATETKADQELMDQLVGLITDPDGVSFTMRFVDRVIRPESNRVAAHQLEALVSDHELPGFVSGLDSILLRAGARLAPLAPALVMPLARRRMRQMVGHLVVDAEPTPLERHLARRRAEGYRQNVNLLGEAVLGQGEADRRFQATLALLDQPDVDYVSVKVSAIAPQLEPWAWDDSIKRIVERLRPLYERAAATSPPTFVNLDMEEYHDLDMTIAAFTQLLTEPALRGVDAGIVLQAYLPDALPALQGLAEWASDRKLNGGGSIKVRLVKGANLAMERVDAAMHGWDLAPLASKAETDANYVRCLDWVLTPERLVGLRIGVASHNLFHVAFARLLAQGRDVTDHVEFEMLQGMAPAEARVVRGETGNLLLYTPIVGARDFDVAISYLFRRLEETAAPDNFLRSLFSLAPGSPSFQAEASRFSDSVTNRKTGPLGANRSQTRPAIASHARGVERFVNEPDTDPTLPSNRTWAIDVMKAARHSPPSHPVVDSVSDVKAIVVRARSGAAAWGKRSLEDRAQILRSVADELARRRGDLINAMMHEGDKTFAQADPEVSEAIDFANYYADRGTELAERDGLQFAPLGVVAVVPPWNFPVAIPAGGVLAALAAGNSAILKPAPETPRCGEVVAECAWAAGVPTDALQFARVSENDAGQELITAVDAVILTGASQTAALFTSWKPDLKLFAETSGKNAMIITPNADLDLAVANLTDSAFGHSGQKCSAASLVICVGDVYESPRFRRQLVDAVRSMDVGPATTASTAVGPIISQPSPQLHRALTQLDPGEEWLVTPELRDGPGGEGRLWSPGVRTGVVTGSWFHQTECFGPVLGVMRAATLDEAIAIANSSAFGLTGGIQSLDPDEIEQWLAQIEVGNAYVNRGITGAIVQRQPFGGWKRSSVGPGAKAGGPNYVQQLGTWTDVGAGQGDTYDSGWLDRARAADRIAWADYFGIEHDPTGLFCEANRFRYRPHPRLAVRVASDADPVAVDRVRAAIEICGSTAEWSNATTETADQFAARWPALNIERVRIVGSVEPELWPAARGANVHLETRPVVADSRIELLHYVREQSISHTLHRFGNLIGAIAVA